MEAAAVAVNDAVALPAGTLTEAGTGSRALLLESVTRAPPEGAALERVTVQEEAAPAFSDVGLQASDERTLGATSETEAVIDAPAKVAVSVAD